MLSKSHLSLLEKETKLTPVLKFIPVSTNEDELLLGFALEQIGAQLFIDKELNGKGVKIGIIDGGFLNANKDQSLSHFFKNNSIKYYKDFITPELKPYGGAHGLDDIHGTEVWQLIGGINTAKEIQYGLATKAQYYLARTDHGGFEKRIEEDYIIEALEEMAKLGVKLFNISLGYTEDFTDKKENYSISDVDGKTSLLTKALDKAAEKEGLLFIVAAGNDGAANWKTLSIPADAKNVLTVGASKFKIWDKINYSSIGPEALDYIKPNIAVYSTLGTSFSAPVITGLAACIMQYDSTLTNFEIIELLERASNFYPFGNNYVGYGVPTCMNVLALLQGKELTEPKSIRTQKKILKLKGEYEGKTIVIYHKKDSRNVVSRINTRPKNDKLQINRPKDIRQSTILVETEITEIIWED
ncbi:MAG: S8 family serine peptidase [Cyclobacteriaceae bacterium]